nr:MAG TPA: hypothetical protein [Caudoviricetes sp.]
MIKNKGHSHNRKVKCLFINILDPYFFIFFSQSEVGVQRRLS